MLFRVKFAKSSSEYVSEFFVKTCCFFSATEIARVQIEEECEEEEEWQILSIKTLLNFIEDESEEMENDGENTEYVGSCSNPFKTYEHSAPLLQMDFACPTCKEVLHLSLNNWEAVFCPTCKTKINRAEVTKTDEGKWVFKKVVEEKKK
jgi:hypothetical protein